MKLVPLTRGLFAQVDDEDYDFLMQWKWYALKGNNTYYAVRNSKKGDVGYLYHKRSIFYMHRVILGIADNKIEGDHIDHNGLNCQRINLRKCTRIENLRNKSVIKKKTSSKYLGVFPIKMKVTRALRKSKRTVTYTYNYFVAAVFVNKKRVFQKKYKCEIDAAKAYDIAATKYFGEFANLNFK